MAQTCRVCKGLGQLWGTPPFIVTGGLQSANPAKYPLADPNPPLPLTTTYGMSVPCWKCVGKGYTPDDRQDAGEEVG